MGLYDEDFHLAAGADLSSLQYRALAIGGTLATNEVYGAVGILQNHPQSGEDCEVRLMGRSKFHAGAAIAKGARLLVTSGGFMTTAGSGDTSCGFAEFACSSGAYGEGFFNFVTLMYHVSSAG